MQVVNEYSLNGKVKVSVNLSNTGNQKGKEIVQLYIRDKFASVARPVKELKGFELVELDKGESQVVNFELTKEELGFFDNRGEFIFEPGDFDIFVGGSSATEMKKEIVIK